MICPNCQAEIDKTYQICPECRHPTKVPSANLGWGRGNMAVFIIGSIAFPPIGIIAGLYSLTEQPKRKQAITLLVVGFLALAFWYFAYQFAVQIAQQRPKMSFQYLKQLFLQLV